MAKQAGVELFYQTDVVKGLRTKGVTGTLSAQDAVSKILEGTPLVLKTDSSGAMLIGLPGQANEEVAGAWRVPSGWSEPRRVYAEGVEQASFVRALAGRLDAQRVAGARCRVDDERGHERGSYGDSRTESGGHAE